MEMIIKINFGESKIKLLEQVKFNLDKIKNTKGVENVVLTQRDGNPIQHSGIWLSKNEIFCISAATSAIFNCGIHLHNNNLKYILIEGKKAKILLSPLMNYGGETLRKIIEAQGLQGNNNDFFLAITTQQMINLGSIFLKTRNNIVDIKKALILSGESFKPPLRHFTDDKMDDMFDSINVKEDITYNNAISYFSFNISEDLNQNLSNILNDFSNHTLDLVDTFITFDGGFVIAEKVNLINSSQPNLDAKATMSYSLFSTADKCAWLLKKMHVDSILLECNNYFQFIHKVGNGIFSTTISKGRQKLGLLRLIIPRYAKKIKNILEKINMEFVPTGLPQIQDFFSELSI